MKNEKRKKVIAIVGPTGSGKTDWAKFLVKKFNGRIISADSRQVYKELEIGTAKDRTVKQDLIDIVSLGQVFTLAQYQKEAISAIKKCFEENVAPFLVGGTGLYLDAVLYGYEIPNIKKQSEKIRSELEKISTVDLLSQLGQVDPVFAQKVDPHNKRRIIRALEYFLLNKKPFSENKKKKKTFFDFLIIGIEMPRETLYAKVDARVEQMIKDGLVEEVRSLIKKYPKDMPAFNTIGYKEIIDYLSGKGDLASAKEKIKFNTHAYIRRQETWFRHNKDIKWVKTLEEAEKKIKRFLN